jgi:hypothetical protein
MLAAVTAAVVLMCLWRLPERRFGGNSGEWLLSALRVANAELIEVINSQIYCKTPLHIVYFSVNKGSSGQKSAKNKCIIN